MRIRSSTVVKTKLNKNRGNMWLGIWVYDQSTCLVSHFLVQNVLFVMSQCDGISEYWHQAQWQQPSLQCQSRSWSDFWWLVLCAWVCHLSRCPLWSRIPRTLRNRCMHAHVMLEQMYMWAFFECLNNIRDGWYDILLCIIISDVQRIRRGITKCDFCVDMQRAWCAWRLYAHIVMPIHRARTAYTRPRSLLCYMSHKRFRTFWGKGEIQSWCLCWWWSCSHNIWTHCTQSECVHSTYTCTFVHRRE